VSAAVIPVGERMSDKVFAALRGVIAKQMQLDEAKVTLAAKLEELGVKSLDLVEIIMSIEDEFAIEIPDDAMQASSKYKTVGDLVELGDELIAAKG